MNVFSAKSIGLYSLAIGSAIGFFQIVTSYGEAHIKAPISVAGNYLITAQNLPDCLQQKQLVLKLQQSGVYLNASIVKDKQDLTNNRDTRPTFSGRLQARQLNLSGTLPPEICPQSSQLQIAGTITNTRTATDSPLVKDRETLRERQQLLKGKLWLATGNSQRPAPVEFTGTLQLSNRSAQSH
jgi:hypothetical protein